MELSLKKSINNLQLFALASSASKSDPDVIHFNNAWKQEDWYQFKDAMSKEVDDFNKCKYWCLGKKSSIDTLNPIVLFDHGVFELKPVLLLLWIVEMHHIRVTVGGKRSKCRWVEIVYALFREIFMTFVPGEECTQG